MRAAHLLALSAFLSLGCSTGISLTSAGEGVRRVSAADAPTGCNLLGDVAIGIPPDAARPRTEEQLVILMRNKAGLLGGNHVVVDSTDERRDEGATEPHWVGRGVAYACPIEATASAPDEPSAGGDDGEEDMPEDNADGEEDGASDEEMDELLEGI
ncbi:MAG: hypothetical protein AB8I08_14745 [Sandaracinaceae bacterium]